MTLEDQVVNESRKEFKENGNRAVLMSSDKKENNMKIIEKIREEIRKLK